VRLPGIVGLSTETDTAFALSPAVVDLTPFVGGGRYIKAAPLRPRKLFEDDEPETEVAEVAKPKPPISLIKEALKPGPGPSVVRDLLVGVVPVMQENLPVESALAITEPSRPRLTPMMAALLDDD
jgi:hypothetical protein